jgi:hypothetical protein
LSAGVATVDPKSLITSDRRQKLEKYVALLADFSNSDHSNTIPSTDNQPAVTEPDDEFDLDTVGAIAVDLVRFSNRIPSCRTI